jgi:hypothetical protein
MKTKSEEEKTAFIDGLVLGLVSGITLSVAFLFAMLANFSLL